MTFNETYFGYQKKYSDIYGKKTIAFIQKGTFYEAYATKNRGQNLEVISDIIKTTLTRSNGKSGEEVCVKNPYMIGFPVIKAAKNLNFLTQAGYTVVLFDEFATFDEKHEKTIDRKISGIYSPGTYVPDDRPINSSNYLLTVYIVEEKQLKGAPNLHAIGLTLIDIVTAHSVIHEFYSSQTDTNFGLDELFRFIQIFKPNEVVIYYHPIDINDKTISSMKSYLELESIPQCYFCIYHKNNEPVVKDKPERVEDVLSILNEKKFNKIYQNSYLTKIYNLEDQISLNKTSALEIMSLEKKEYAVISLIILLQFLTNHNVNLLTNLAPPEVYVYSKHLILGNNAIDQLNVISSNNLQSSDDKITSLFSVVNKTTTIMGKRFLKNNLANPFSKENKQKISERYEYIHQIITDKLAQSLVLEMKNIHDIERMHRKMALGTIYPAEFYRLDQSYQRIIKLITVNSKNKILKNMIHPKVITKFMQYQKKYADLFIMEELSKYFNTNYTDIGKSFFQPGINEEVDSLQKKIDNVSLIVDGITAHFKNVILSNTKSKKKNYKDKMISVKHDDNGGYYFSITKIKEKILRKYLEEKEHIMIDLPDDRLKIKTSDIEFRALKKGNTKIFISSIDEQTTKLHERKERMTELLKNLFSEKIMEIYSEYKGILYIISNFVSELDFLVSGSLVAEQYYYCRPKILDDDVSYFNAVQLRHPIIERLCQDGNNGMLLYSINFCGKCLKPDTKVMMINGIIKMVKDIVVGDQLMGDDSQPRNVLATCKGRGEMYQIIPDRGEPYTVNGPHILSLKSSAYQTVTWDNGKEQRYRAIWMENHIKCSKSFSISKYGSKEAAYEAAEDFLNRVTSDKGKILDISVDEFMKKSHQWKRNYYTYRVGTTFPEQEVELDPYIVGRWLGDGNSNGPKFTSADQEIVNYYMEYFEDKGLHVSYKDNYHYSVTNKVRTGGSGRNWFLNMLRKYDLLNNKHIPREYLLNSRENQLKLLAGLIDSDGSNSNNRSLEITQKNERLADDIVYLARSLGFFCEKRQCRKTCTNAKNGPVTGTYYRMNIIGDDYTDIPLLMEYKRPASFAMKRKMSPLITGFKIKPMGKGNYCGFELDGNHRFLLSDHQVTHNSSLMKSVGLAVILAQVGYYVPAKEFSYAPYMAIYARINANDNILKGLSSFVLEMTELDAILKRVEINGENTMVIGDEVCRGTEVVSATSIVASTLMHLSAKNTTFMFSSHLHELSEIEEIKALKNLRIFHLNVIIDKENDNLIFERKLIPGTGPKIYGVMVAKYLINNPKFINNAEIIKNRMIKSDITEFPEKVSNFNPKLLMTKCAICEYKPTEDYHKELETHHINFQCDCLKDGKIKDKPYLSKNGLYNLITLCRKCHVKVHKKEILISSYQDTSKGPKLFYTK